MAAGNTSALLSDAAVKHDLLAIGNELKKPICVVIDEGDVLARSRTHLEKLRNIFMNVPGYMLVLAGTPELFPMMDTVFSPIARQFNRIRLLPFESRDETRALIEAPLQKIGIGHPSEIFAFETFRDVSDIHDMSGGRPYEIQLLCHFLFKRVQENSATRMQITLDVLDEVRKQLEATQDVGARPLLSSVRALSDESLRALNVLAKCNGRGSFEQIWFVEKLFWGESRWSESNLRRHLGELARDGVLSTSAAGSISFAGDDFDRIYCKYYARHRKLVLSIDNQDFETYYRKRLQQFLHNAFAHERASDFAHLNSEPGEPVRMLGVTPEGGDSLLPLANKIRDRHPEPFDGNSSLAELYYWICVDFQGHETIPLVRIETVSPWPVTLTNWYLQAPNTPYGRDVGDAVESFLAECSENAATLGGRLDVQRSNLPICSSSDLVQILKNGPYGEARDRIGRGHARQVHLSYPRSREAAEVIADARIAFELVEQWISANDAGYLEMAVGELDASEAALGAAIRLANDPKERALSLYNLAMVQVMRKDVRAALKTLDLVIETLGDQQRPALCLFVPTGSNDGEGFEERWDDPELSSIMIEARDALLSQMT
jgi:tetratricopeptide (TPR) repeat protein